MILGQTRSCRSPKPVNIRAAGLPDRNGSDDRSSGCSGPGHARSSGQTVPVVKSGLGKRALDISGEVVTLADIMNKNITLTGVLVVILLLSAIANLALCVRYVRTVSAAQRLQAISGKLQVQTALVARNRSLMQSIANDAMEYSKKNSAMAALLQQYNPLLEQLHLAKPQQGTAPRQNK